MPFLGHWYALIFFIAFWGGIIALIVWAVRRLSGGSRPDTALGILKERFARGEIDQEEYEKRKRALEQP